MTTDTSEKGLESIIVRAMTGRVDVVAPGYTVSEISPPVADGTGWILGDPKHYDRGACVDLVQLRGFLMLTQPKLVDGLQLETDTPVRRQFLARLEKEIRTRCVVDVLRIDGFFCLFQMILRETMAIDLLNFHMQISIFRLNFLLSLFRDQNV